MFSVRYGLFGGLAGIVQLLGQMDGGKSLVQGVGGAAVEAYLLAGRGDGAGLPALDELAADLAAEFAERDHRSRKRDGADEDALIRAADAAMYRVKSSCESERQHRLPLQ